MEKSVFELVRSAHTRAVSAHTRLKQAKSFKERGLTAIEMGLVLLVAAIIIAGAMKLYRDNQRNQSVNANVSDVVATAGALVSKYGQLNRYGDVTTELAVKSGTIPSHLRDPGADTAQNRFGGPIEVAPVSLTGTNDGVAITWPNVPANQCSGIISGSQGEFRVISVDGTEVKGDGAELDIEGLEDACDADAPVEIIFTAGRF